MILREFKTTDLQHMNRWMVKRHLPPVTEAELPKLGFYIPGVAAGFLRSCEGAIGIVDGIITNPLVSGAVRHKALNKIFETMLSQPGFNSYILATLDETMFSRGVLNNFKPISHQLMVHVRS